MKPLKKNATYDDLREVPDHYVAEMFSGALYASPRPALPRARAASLLGATLIGPFDQGRNGPGGWLFLYEPELHFGNDVVVPDIAAWRRRQWAQRGILEGSAIARAAPFDALELELGTLWT